MPEDGKVRDAEHLSRHVHRAGKISAHCVRCGEDVTPVEWAGNKYCPLCKVNLSAPPE